eukprot:TRINITY_DN3066_c0_g1_i1.p3 TRINITY_DN3066_c0_g1~~TRINITY_DN3066_c0_g1_i1.p3  ORF type:complete len:113 (-),score=26.14 TRINITY_DN3066_c0_g1_i1:102-440(-)
MAPVRALLVLLLTALPFARGSAAAEFRRFRAARAAAATPAFATAGSDLTIVQASMDLPESVRQAPRLQPSTAIATKSDAEDPSQDEAARQKLIHGVPADIGAYADNDDDAKF